MSQTSPLVSVIMSTYNDAWATLQRALESILAQTFEDFELVLLFEPDDSNFERVRRNYSERRLILIQNETRKGMAESFNIGLAKGGGRYIARMDSDDYAYPHRLQKELQHLKANPQLAVLGSAVRLVDANGKHLGFRRPPQNHKSIARYFAINNPILHPTVVWDRQRVGYDLRYNSRMIQEDLELWLRLLSQGHRFANLPDVLLDYTQPVDYCRPREVWRSGLDIRSKHWRLGFRYPLFFLGIGVRFTTVVMPQSLVDSITKRNRLSDRFRTISGK